MKFNKLIEILKKDIIVSVLIIISILILIFSFFAPFIFTISTAKSGFNFDNTGAIGDTIGGLMNPFIAIAGVFITFLAFYMQFRANQIQLKLFNSSQKEQIKLIHEQFFFRIIDNLNQKLTNFSYTEILTNENGENDKIEHFSYKALDNIIKNFKSSLSDKTIYLGRHLLSKMPEQIAIVHYIKILQANYGLKPFENANELKDSIVEIKSYNERWEFVKRYVGSTHYETSKQKDALRAIGSVQFYKIDYEEKEDIYKQVFDTIYKEFGGFMDGYLKNFTYMINFVSSSDNKIFFLEYLKNNLSTQELILVFYFCASRKSNQSFRDQVKNLELLNNLYLFNNEFIDLPSQEELSIEIENVLSRSDA